MGDEESVAPAIPVHAAANHRRSVLFAVPVGVIGAVVLAVVGHPLASVFLVLGLALGAINTLLVQRSVARFAAGIADQGGKMAFVGNVLFRLGVITVIALGIVLLVRPDGVAIIAGLAIFQLLMVGNASLPVIKELRKA